MSAILAAVHLHDINGMPADDSINTFAISDGSTGGSPLDLCTEVSGPLGLFYTGGSAPVSSFLSSSLDIGTMKADIVYYQLAPTGSVVPVTPLGGPLLTTHFSLGTGGGSSLPREVAACLSYHADMTGLPEDVPGGAPGPAGDTHPAARHRGRIYLGPLANNALGAGVNGPGVYSGLRTSATNAAASFMSAMGAIAIGPVRWCVWSRVNHALYPITGGWMDDAFDTQRRRGIEATQRTTF
jgi:hypothetical protein